MEISRRSGAWPLSRARPRRQSLLRSGGIQCILEIQAQTQGRTLELSRFCQQPGGGGAFLSRRCPPPLGIRTLTGLSQAKGERCGEMGWSGCWAWVCGQRKAGEGGTRVPTLAPRGQGPTGPGLPLLHRPRPRLPCCVMVAWHSGCPGTVTPGRADRDVVAGCVLLRRAPPPQHGRREAARGSGVGGEQCPPRAPRTAPAAARMGQVLPELLGGPSSWQALIRAWSPRGRPPPERVTTLEVQWHPPPRPPASLSQSGGGGRARNRGESPSGLVSPLRAWMAAAQTQQPLGGNVSGRFPPELPRLCSGGGRGGQTSRGAGGPGLGGALSWRPRRPLPARDPAPAPRAAHPEAPKPRSPEAPKPRSPGRALGPRPAAAHGVGRGRGSGRAYRVVPGSPARSSSRPAPGLSEVPARPGGARPRRAAPRVPAAPGPWGAAVTLALRPQLSARSRSWKFPGFAGAGLGFSSDV
ncbi:collagen alpha-1(III) chain-like [Felis catus]|uniref:collagen alpha-1(III) chain-like n=1 Tax=Felis catus TaxID=9685 RepID=UPI001D19DF10|nr:collagen alpha-1(III) chain-like [Felis catus]